LGAHGSHAFARLYFGFARYFVGGSHAAADRFARVRTRFLGGAAFAFSRPASQKDLCGSLRRTTHKSRTALTVIDLHIETVRVQLPIRHVAASLEPALSRFNSTIKAFRTFNCDYFLYALELRMYLKKGKKL
jgi:hypothetical protein